MLWNGLIVVSVSERFLCLIYLCWCCLPFHISWDKIRVLRSKNPFSPLRSSHLTVRSESNRQPNDCQSIPFIWSSTASSVCQSSFFDYSNRKSIMFLWTIPSWEKSLLSIDKTNFGYWSRINNKDPNSLSLAFSVSIT